MKAVYYEDSIGVHYKISKFSLTLKEARGIHFIDIGD